MDFRFIDEALGDPGFFVDHDPHPLWKELRDNDPIHWTEGAGKPFWSVTRYEDIVSVVSEPTLFSSAYLIGLPSSPEMEQVTPEQLGSGEMMLMTDPPLHGAMRRAFNRLLLPRTVGRFEAPGLQLVREIVEEAMARDECDFVVDVAARMPMAFICEIMGIPREDWPNMFKWGNMVAGNEDPEYQVDSGSALDTREEGSRSIGRYCMDASLDRRGGSGEDLLSVLG
jgi:cholest-4-en-3-one 26-monooxygenase